MTFSYYFWIWPFSKLHAIAAKWISICECNSTMQQTEYIMSVWQMPHIGGPVKFEVLSNAWLQQFPATPTLQVASVVNFIWSVSYKIIKFGSTLQCKCRHMTFGIDLAKFEAIKTVIFVEYLASAKCRLFISATHSVLVESKIYGFGQLVEHIVWIWVRQVCGQHVRQGRCWIKNNYESDAQIKRRFSNGNRGRDDWQTTSHLISSLHHQHHNHDNQLPGEFTLREWW